ncbi:MAG TPA: SPOR domain-containing protein [Ignavibacteriaceae bacterium]|nr:SPOR domain-containing protein [Ignavibacteriaceae bacterium]
MVKFLKIVPFILLLLAPAVTYSQEVNIIPYLKQIEAGEKGKAVDALKDLKDEYPDDPSVMFLDGVLTENGQNAVAIFKTIIDKYPKSRYADASLYRIYSYYYALGLYQTSKKFLAQLKREYPQSPYIQIAEKKIPAKDEVSGEDKVEKERRPEKPKTENKNKTKKTDYKFTIQAGAFSNSDNAASLKKSFSDAGFFSETQEKNVAGTSFTIVYVGKFLNEDEARNFLEVIKQRFQISGRVVPIN